MEEYSYYRAKGRSLQAIETCEEAVAELKSLNHKLCSRYGAMYFPWGLDSATGRIQPKDLIFRKEEQVPEGWKVSQRQLDWQEKEVEAVFAFPAQGSKDAFFIAGIAGLMERACRLSSLEGVFDCGAPILKNRPAGDYSPAFVREGTKIVQGLRAGNLKERSTVVYSSNGAFQMQDPMQALQILGEWYIRVPNTQSGEPFFLPPDAEKVALMEMLRLDARECMKQNPRMVPPPYL